MALKAFTSRLYPPRPAHPLFVQSGNGRLFPNDSNRCCFHAEEARGWITAERSCLRKAKLPVGVGRAQPTGGAGVRPCRRMTSATFAMSGGPPGVDVSTS
jgi:hypothetical protein